MQRGLSPHARRAFPTPRIATTAHNHPKRASSHRVAASQRSIATGCVAERRRPVSGGLDHLLTAAHPRRQAKARAQSPKRPRCDRRRLERPRRASGLYSCADRRKHERRHRSDSAATAVATLASGYARRRAAPGRSVQARRARGTPPAAARLADAAAAPLAPAHRHGSTVGLAQPMRPLCTAAGARTPMPTLTAHRPASGGGRGPLCEPSAHAAWCRRSRRMRQSRLKYRRHISSTNE